MYFKSCNKPARCLIVLEAYIYKVFDAFIKKWHYVCYYGKKIIYMKRFK